MKFQVRTTLAADREVVSILEWISARSPAGATAWFAKWLEAIESLKERADEIGLAPESGAHSEPIHQIVFRTKRGQPYRAVFVIRQLDVHILHVRGPGQDNISPDELRL